MINDKDLKNRFWYYNERYFSNKIHITDVRFATDKKVKKCDGIYFIKDNRILINQRLAHHSDFAAVALIHEMVHAYLYQNGYVGYDSDGGHHIMFYSEINRLYHAGIYEGLL